MAGFAELADKFITLARLLIRRDFAGLKRLMRVNNLFVARNIVRNFTDMRALLLHVDMPLDTGNPTRLPKAAQGLPERYTHMGRDFSLADWQSERMVCSMVVLKSGQIAYEAYFHGTKAADRRIGWSISKSVLSATMGVLNDQGKLPHFATRIGDIVPALAGSAYANATLRNVLNMASGVAFNEDYLDYHSDIKRMARVLAIGGSIDQFAADMTAQAWTPGQYSHYVSIDTHVLGMVMRSVTGRRTDELMRELLFDPMGLEQAPYLLTDGLGEPFVLGGLNMTTRDYARFGLMMAQGGQLGGRQIVPDDWVAASTRQSAPPPDPETAPTPTGALGYGYQWWLPPDPAKGEFFAVGIYGQYIYVNSQAQVVVALNSADRQFRDGDGAPSLQNIAVFRQIAAAL